MVALWSCVTTSTAAQAKSFVKHVQVIDNDATKEIRTLFEDYFHSANIVYGASGVAIEVECLQIVHIVRIEGFREHTFARRIHQTHAHLAAHKATLELDAHARRGNAQRGNRLGKGDIDVLR